MLCIDNERTFSTACRRCSAVGVAACSRRADLAEALAAIEGSGLDPDGLLVDYHLDGGNGLGVISELRRRYGRDLRAILVTADRSLHVREEARAAGVQVLNKPVKPASLRALSRNGAFSASRQNSRCRGARSHGVDDCVCRFFRQLPSSFSMRCGPKILKMTPGRERAMTQDYEIFELGDVRLQRGATIRNCKLAYKTFGQMNAAKSNVIVYPTWYSGQHYDNEWLIGPGMALDPARYFIIIPNMLGNGLSSSPSNTPAPHDGPRFPQVTACDNVRLQHRLVTEKFGVKRLALVAGWSMGALQTFHWGALYPDMVERIAPFCGSAKCSRHNFVFLEGVKAAPDG